MQRRQFRSLVYSEAQCGMIAEALNKIFIAQSPSLCIRAHLERLIEAQSDHRELWEKRKFTGVRLRTIQSRALVKLK